LIGEVTPRFIARSRFLTRSMTLATGTG